jgi:hypothetical protein
MKPNSTGASWASTLDPIHRRDISPQLRETTSKSSFSQSDVGQVRAGVHGLDTAVIISMQVILFFPIFNPGSFNCYLLQPLPLIYNVQTFPTQQHDVLAYLTAPSSLLSAELEPSGT